MNMGEIETARTDGWRSSGVSHSRSFPQTAVLHVGWGNIPHAVAIDQARSGEHGFPYGAGQCRFKRVAFTGKKVLLEDLVLRGLSFQPIDERTAFCTFGLVMSN
jgi:hypothetical protein